MTSQQKIIATTEKYSAANYLPLPLVISRAEGVWVWDTDGNRYLDCLSAYSALNQGHRHPRIIQALINQANRLTLTSRAFHNDQMGSFLQQLCDLSDMEVALPMNTGVEAVETAIKAARKWGYDNKPIERDRAEIIVFSHNFHGRTVTAISLSSEPSYRRGFGPFTPGFRQADYGDLGAVKDVLTNETVAVLLEPIQGEAGINIPPEGFLSGLRKLCTEHGVLMVLDEIQTGLGRTGKMFCHEHEREAKPDILIVGKALGGGVYPVSAVLASHEILSVFGPGTHGSTFGGNPLAAAVAKAALDVVEQEQLPARSAELGDYLMGELNRLPQNDIAEIRGRGLLIGIELKKSVVSARPYCEQLMRRGILCKETHDRVIRLSPPLIIEKNEIDHLVEQLNSVLTGDFARQSSEKLVSSS
ncbi:MAG: ornithine--oxo-acid transaminase [Arenicellales bacterium]|nr:ornithine--oxo-acid transaminase [Arenicellales bacterium]